MSVDGYLGAKRGELRLKGGDVPADRVEGEVLEGALSVEEAQAKVVRRVWRAGERYKSVADYDPVLRAHCRLDREG